MLNTITKLKFCELFLRQDNILQINIFGSQDIFQNEVKIMVTESLKLTNGIPYPVIIFVGEFCTFSKDAREYSASEPGKLACTAEAYVINNYGHNMIGNFYMKINKPVKPVKFFFAENLAIKWLRDYMVIQ